MKKLLIAIAAVAICGQTAMADDFDNTSLSIAADGSAGGVELSTSEGVRSLSLTTPTDQLPVQLGVKWIDNATGTDWEISLARRFDLLPAVEGESLSIYATPKLTYATGDSYTNNELTLKPTLGAEYDLGKSAVYGAVGLEVDSNDTDYFDWGRGNTSVDVGIIVPVAGNFDMDLGITRSMDKDFSNATHQAGVKFILKY